MLRAMGRSASHIQSRGLSGRPGSGKTVDPIGFISEERKNQMKIG